jgi:hypothetical protein
VGLNLPEVGVNFSKGILKFPKKGLNLLSDMFDGMNIYCFNFYISGRKVNEKK